MVNAEREAQSIYHSWKEDAAAAANVTNGELHPSFENCDLEGGATWRIDIHVKLTPSVTACEIEIQTLECEEDDEPATKKAKTVKFQQSDGEDAQPRQRMSVDDILKQMATAVPPIACVRLNGANYNTSDAPIDTAVNAAECQYLCMPVGELVGFSGTPFKTTIKKQESTFAIALASGACIAASQYHKSVQKMAHWFIETADDVDLGGNSDGCDNGGYWKVLYLFRQHEYHLISDDNDNNNPPPPKVQYSFAGYWTLFHFHAPFKKPEPGIIMRICQALILPPYQRAGLGSYMMGEVYALADCYIGSSRTPIVEINVEDPAPSFTALRDACDYKHYERFLSSKDYVLEPDVDDDNYFTSYQDDEGLAFIALSNKITKRQVLIAQEIMKLRELEQWKKKGQDSNSIEEKETKYRLMLKKALKARRKEELLACSSKDEMKAMLEEWFQKTLAYYKRILGIKS